MQIGFIGIGVMGWPMTLNLLKAEHVVTVCARRPDKPEVQEVLNAGAKLAPSARAVAMASDIVITMLPNSPQVEEVVTGPQGVLEGVRKGLIIVDMSTIAPAVSRKLAQEASIRGVHLLDAPVSGGSQGAELARPNQRVHGTCDGVKRKGIELCTLLLLCNEAIEVRTKDT